MYTDNTNVGSAYLKYYSTQHGHGAGDITIYRRPRIQQTGDGIGDILRGVARFLLPIFFRGAKTFASETLRGTEGGLSIGNAAKQALKPTLGAVAGAAAKQFQGGLGKKRKSKKKKRAKVTKTADSQAGSGKLVKSKKKRVYKGDSLGTRQQSGGFKIQKRKKGIGKAQKRQKGSGKAQKRKTKARKSVKEEGYNF